VVGEVFVGSVKMIRHEGAPDASFFPAGPKHKVIDDQLTAITKQLGQRLTAVIGFELIRLFDGHPGQLPPHL